MPAIKVVATAEGTYNNRVILEGQTFILVDKVIPERKKPRRAASIYTAEAQFSENWMEKVGGATPAELSRAQQVADLQYLTSEDGQAGIPGQAKQGGMLGAPEAPKVAVKDKKLTPAEVLASQQQSGSVKDPDAPVVASPLAAGAQEAAKAPEASPLAAAPAKAL